MSVVQPEVQTASVKSQQYYQEKPFPLVLKCSSTDSTTEGLCDWISTHRSELLEQVEDQGVVLLRGFPLDSAEDFDKVITAFELENFPYERSLSNAVRVNFTPRVFSANEAPPDVKIYLHHEMAQTPIYPSKLFFFCLKPAEEGGATPVCRSDILFQRICESWPQFAQDCEEKGLKYSNVMPGENDADSGMGRSWQSTFSADSMDEAETRMRELGYSWEWLDDGCLQATTPALPAVRELSGNRKVFFNQLIAAFRGWKDSRNDPTQSIRFGDGSALDRDIVLQVAETAEELTFDVKWEKGDFAIVDNYLAMHGRRTFSGTRKVLASLVAANQHSFA